MTIFDDIVADAEAELLDLDAARAEIWVSAVFAMWRQPGDDEGLAPEEVDHLLLQHLAAHPSRGGLAIALAAEAVAPAPFAAEAADAAERIRAAGIDPPPWAPVAGTAHPVAAWSLTDPHGGSESLVLGFEHADAVRHALLVEIDHADGGLAVDLLFSPGELLDAIAEGADPALRTRALAPEEAARLAVAALDRTAGAPDPVVTDEFLMNWYVADTRLRRLAGAGAPVPSGSLPVAEDRAAEDRAAEDRAAEDRAAEDRAAEDRAAEDRAAEDRAAEDRVATEVLRSALRRPLDAPEPVEAVVAAAARFRATLAHDPDARILLAAAGCPADAADRPLLVALAGALVRPRTLDAFSPVNRRLVLSLEWADWLGVVVELVREGAGADADPSRFVGLVNRCPEVTSTIPKRDAPGVVAAFEQVVFAWELAGATDDGRLTPLGVWLLPQALLACWSGAG